MTYREEVVRTLHAHRFELAATYGVRRLVSFGSVARDEATGPSDVDMLVEFDRAVGYFGLVELQDRHWLNRVRDTICLACNSVSNC